MDSPMQQFSTKHGIVGNGHLVHLGSLVVDDAGPARGRCCHRPPGLSNVKSNSTVVGR
jgi:hypothetical protein